MGIRVKNLGNYVMNLVAPGTITAATGKDLAVAPFAGYIVNCYATISDGGTGVTSSVVDIHKNGVTVFKTATKMTFVATTGVCTYSTFFTTALSVSAGDVFQLDVDSIATSPKNLHVSLLLSRTPVDTETNVADLDTLV